jgi:hypothetical protein
LGVLDAVKLVIPTTMDDGALMAAVDSFRFERYGISCGGGQIRG